MSSDTDRIRLLNDQLRQKCCGSGVVITPGIAALGPEAVARLILKIATFDDFCKANDPGCEHEFGAFVFDGTEVFFKIDCYGRQLNCHSPHQTDPAVTERVITLMLAAEY